MSKKDQDKNPTSAKVLSLAKHAEENLNSSAFTSAIDLLRAAVKECEETQSKIENAESQEQAEALFRPVKCLIILLDDRDEKYDTRFRNAGMRMSEAITLCHIAQARFTAIMGYGNPHGER